MATDVTPRLRLLLAGLFSIGFTVGTDVVGAGVLLDPIEQEFETTISTTQWVINAYALTFAMSMVTGGRLGDMYGRRKLLLIGLGVFATASVACALSPDIWFLIGARMIQGVGAAIVWPCALGLLFLSVPDEKAGGAIGILLGLVGIGNAVGPLVGGGLSDLAVWGWRLFFVFNVVTASLSLLLVSVATRGGHHEPLKPERIDYAGITVLATAFFALLLAFDLSTARGWGSSWVLGLLVLAAVSFLAFPFVEKRMPEPLIPPRLWRNTPFVAGVFLNGQQIAPAFILIVFVPQLGQRVWGYSDFQAAMLLLPFVVCFTGLAPIAGRIYDRIGGRRLIGAGYVMVVAGTLWIALVPDTLGFWGWLLPGEALIGAGGAFSIGPSGTLAVASVREDEVSLAGGISFQWHLTAAAIGIAAATLIITSSVQSELRDTIENSGHQVSQQELRTIQGIEHGNPDAVIASSHLPTETQRQLKADVSSGFEIGLRRAFWFATGFAGVGLLLVPVGTRSRRQGA